MIGGKNGGTIYQWTLGWYVSAAEVAVKFGHKNIAKLLMDRSPPDVKLLVACWLGDEKTARTLRGTEIAESDRNQIAHAARNNVARSVRLMLEFGFPVDARGQEGGTPLHWAAWHGNLAMLKTILRHNPPLEIEDTAHHGKPISWAIYGSEHGWRPGRGNYPACVKALIKAGAKLPAKLDGSKAVQNVLRRHGIK